MEAYASELEELPSHLFRADLQHQQMKLCIQGMQKNEACICMEYAENYQCRFQREVQSAFFDQNQVTIHPMAYYKERMENEELLVKHAIIGITDDYQKGALGVKMFEKEAIIIIEREKGKSLRTVHEFTDGCASQYKGKISFFDISKQKEPDVTLNFFLNKPWQVCL